MGETGRSAVNISPDTILLIWAKTGRGLRGERTWHPLICHMADVSCVALVLWRHAPSAWRRWIAEELRLDEDLAVRWLALWAGLHDLGKASPAFQLQESARGSFAWDVAARLRAEGLPVHPHGVRPVPHGQMTSATLRQILSADFGLPAELARGVAVAVGGHHGILPEFDEIDLDALGQTSWDRLRQRLAETLAGIVDLPRQSAPSRAGIPALLATAGFVSVADWIGSNARFFPHAASGDEESLRLDLEDYVRRARTAAEKALDHLGWTARPQGPPPLSFTELFPAASPPYPVQQATAELADRLPPGPCLVILEAPMGEGKSEAALYVADRRASDAGHEGCYFALPTQATSNQMFGRIRSFLKARYGGERVNLQLLHGHASLSPELAEIRWDLDQPFEPESVHGEDGDAGSPSGVIAAEWFTHRKRGLLAPFGVGTIDQALLAVLRTRHVFVRLYGLSGKCVVVDEVHAYDTYMSALMGRLLEWLGALQTPVVLLSATLPRSRRHQLAAAYARGLGREATDLSRLNAPYPRITWVTRDDEGEIGIAAAPRSRRVLRLDHLPFDEDFSALVARLRELLAEGGCWAVLLNTVGRAQRAYVALREALSGTADDGWPLVDLFHARYPLEERLERENRTLVRFGKEDAVVVFGDGTKRPVRRPSRALLVATQVVEQSLDLDFDVMATETAPVDLVFQRAGRLHRHDRKRPPPFSQPRLWLLSPRMEGVAPCFDASKAVYDEHVLLRSWLSLRDREALRLPEDVEALIESVYGPSEPPSDLPARVRGLWTDSARKQAEAREAEEWEAARRWLKPPSFDGALWRVTQDPKEEEAPDFHEFHQALTRLAEPSVQVVVLWKVNGALRLRPRDSPAVSLQREPSRQEAYGLLLRSLTITDKRIVFALKRREPPHGWRRSALLRHHRWIEFDRSGRAEVDGHVVELHPELGFRVLGEEA